MSQMQIRLSNVPSMARFHTFMPFVPACNHCPVWLCLEAVVSEAMKLTKKSRRDTLTVAVICDLSSLFTFKLSSSLLFVQPNGFYRFSRTIRAQSHEFR
jgi:hypothetical protein